MKTDEINTRNSKYYWDLVNRNEDAPKAAAPAASKADEEEDEFWWVEKMCENPLLPYTMEEILAQIAESERQFAEGDYMEAEAAIDLIEAELDAEDEMELELAEAV